MKNCELCDARFVRMLASLIILVDGSTFDPNDYCTKCEGAVLAERKQTATRNKQAQLRRHREMLRECLRKEPMTAERAKMVAGRINSRHDDAAISAYRCRTVIDPVAYPDRARPHWHVGGDPNRK